MAGMNRRPNLLVSLLAVSVALLSSACASSDNASGPRPENSQPIVFPVQDPTNRVMQARIEGTLSARGRCLYLTVRAPYHLVLPIWPDGFSYEHTDGNISVLDPDGKTVARTGSPRQWVEGCSERKARRCLPS